MSVVLGIHMVQVYIDVGGPTEHWMVKRYPRLPHQRRRILLPVRGVPRSCGSLPCDPIFRLTFTQNWGSQPFQNNVAIEHWEHGRVRNYSVLWAKVIALDGTEYRTAYVAVKDEISIASCASRSFDIQPT